MEFFQILVFASFYCISLCHPLLSDPQVDSVNVTDFQRGIVGLLQNCTTDDDCDIKRSQCNTFTGTCECREGYMQVGGKCE